MQLLCVVEKIKSDIQVTVSMIFDPDRDKGRWWEPYHAIWIRVLIEILSDSKKIKLNHVEHLMKMN